MTTIALRAQSPGVVECSAQATVEFGILKILSCVPFLSTPLLVVVATHASLHWAVFGSLLTAYLALRYGRLMKSGMIRCAQQLQVLWSIVGLISVNVVNVLKAFKFSANLFLHNQSVFKFSSEFGFGIENGNVSLRCNSFPIFVARMKSRIIFRENNVAVPTSLCVLPLFNRFSAINTLAWRFCHREIVTAHYERAII